MPSSFHPLQFVSPKKKRKTIDPLEHQAACCRAPAPRRCRGSMLTYTGRAQACPAPFGSSVDEGGIHDVPMHEIDEHTISRKQSSGFLLVDHFFERYKVSHQKELEDFDKRIKALAVPFKHIQSGINELNVKVEQIEMFAACNNAIWSSNDEVIPFDLSKKEPRTTRSRTSPGSVASSC